MPASRVRLATPTPALLEPLTRWERDPEILALSADDETPMCPEAVAAMLERWQTPRPDDVAFAVLRRERAPPRSGDGARRSDHTRRISPFREYEIASTSFRADSSTP